MNKYISRFTSSARGEVFNPLIYPFLMATLAYGIGFTVFGRTAGVAESSLWVAMYGLGSLLPFVWGVLALGTIVVGITFLLFNLPPAGRISGLVGFMLWTFATGCWAVTGGYLLIFAVGLPNMWFWFWQFFSLSNFKAQDVKDALTISNYEAGLYDDDNGGKELRESNRGRDIQSEGSYDNADDGGDPSRRVDQQ